MRTLSRAEAAEPRRRHFDSLDLRVPLVTDTSKIRMELGFSEVADPTEAVARTVADEIDRLAA